MCVAKRVANAVLVFTGPAAKPASQQIRQWLAESRRFIMGYFLATIVIMQGQPTASVESECSWQHPNGGIVASVIFRRDGGRRQASCTHMDQSLHNRDSYIQRELICVSERWRGQSCTVATVFGGG